MMKREPLLFYIMLKQGVAWFTLASNTQETVHFSRMACNLAPQCNFLYGVFQCQLPEDTIDMEIMVENQ